MEAPRRETGAEIVADLAARRGPSRRPSRADSDAGRTPLAGAAILAAGARAMRPGPTSEEGVQDVGRPEAADAATWGCRIGCLS